MALYTKYRPRRFADIVSHAPIKATLLRALADNQLGHAILLVGPRGIGKTSVARLLAKSLNCEQPKEGEPCNKCSSCLSVNAGSHLDVIEIDAASNRGIDEIRELKERLKVQPSLGKKKVYIIDEVHMLTKEAFNALLKTLEEPPEHVAFIMATTEGHKVPATIISRSQRYDFHPAEKEEIFKALKKVAKGENMAITDQALNIIADLANGGFRDGISLLEQVTAFAGQGEISEETVKEALALPDYKAVIHLVGVILEGDSLAVIEALKSLLSGSGSLEEIVRVWLKVWRELLMLSISNSAPEVLKKLTFGKELTQLSKKTEPDVLLVFCEKLAQLSTQIKVSLEPALSLELLALQANRALAQGRSNEHSDLTQGNNRSETSPADQTVPISDHRSFISNSKNVSAANSELEPAPKIRLPELKPEKLEEKVGIIEKKAASLETDADFNWPEIIGCIKKDSPTLAALLRDSETELLGESLKIYCRFAFHAKRLSELKNRHAIEKEIENCTDRRLTVEVVQGKKETAKTETDLETAVVQVFELEP